MVEEVAARGDAGAQVRSTMCVCVCVCIRSVRLLTSSYCVEMAAGLRSSGFWPPCLTVRS